MNKFSIISILLLASCSSIQHYESPIARKVAIEIENMQNAETQMEAFSNLEKMGDEAVPYIIGQLDNTNKLPIHSISLTNNWPSAFEGLRHYKPELVQEALAAILNQLTGQHFETIYSGSTAMEREKDLKSWRGWCVKQYPKLKDVCLGKKNN
jgi:hypothetical protein